MFRITRGMHVQHIYFPLPVLGARHLDLDEDAEASVDAAAPPAAPAEAREEPADDSAGQGLPHIEALMADAEQPA